MAIREIIAKYNFEPKVRGSIPSLLHVTYTDLPTQLQSTGELPSNQRAMVPTAAVADTSPPSSSSRSAIRAGSSGNGAAAEGNAVDDVPEIILTQSAPPPPVTVRIPSQEEITGMFLLHSLNLGY